MNYIQNKKCLCSNLTIRKKKESVFHELHRDTDCLETLNCPACNKALYKIFLPELNFNIDLCIDGCGGVFFDNREFEKMRTPDVNISTLNDLVNQREYIKIASSLPRVCSTCGTKMLKTKVGKGLVEIDVCPVCGAKFLDANELEAIREAYFGIYEKSIVEFALKNQQAFAVICSDVIKKSNKL